MDEQKPKKRIAIATFIFSAIICVCVVEYFFVWRSNHIAKSSHMDMGLIRYHSQLGWKLSPSWQGRHSHFDFDVAYSTSSTGLRNGASDQRKNSSPVARIALVGDSFTFGLGVNDKDTFHAILDKNDTTREYLNFGVPGYSTDQQFLFIKSYQGTSKIDHYVILFYLGNDIVDNTRAYPIQAPNGKPYFVVDSGNLLLKNTPVPKSTKPPQSKPVTIDSIIFGQELRERAGFFSNFTSSSQFLTYLIPRAAPVEEEVVSRILDERLTVEKKTTFRSSWSDKKRNRIEV